MHVSKIHGASADVRLPIVVVLNRQRARAVNTRFLRKAAEVALNLCAPQQGKGIAGLMDLEEVVVTCVSDKRIAKAHRDFMSIEGATDVITFQHGDILVSADTAASVASDHGHSLDEELLIYIVHGFLHLNGYDDADKEERAAMHAVQDKVWRAVLECLSQH